MRHLLMSPLNLAALLLFGALVMDHLPGLLEPLFLATDGHPEVLSLLLCVFLAMTFAATWFWSARSRR